MDWHKLMNFLRRTNFTLTHNNTAVNLPANPYESEITAYSEGRWNDIQTHDANSVAGSIMSDQELDGGEFPMMESEL